MQDILFDGYKAKMDELIQLSETNHLDCKIYRLASRGEAIEKINNCSKEYQQYCNNLNAMYKATIYYVQKAYNNIQSCEETN